MGYHARRRRRGSIVYAEGEAAEGTCGVEMRVLVCAPNLYYSRMPAVVSQTMQIMMPVGIKRYAREKRGSR